MFARVLDQMKEPFTGSSPTTQGTRSIQNYFTNTLPNIIYNNDPRLDVVSLTEVSNTRISSKQDTLRQKWLQTDNNKALLQKMENDCKNNKGLDPFDRLTDLNATVDQSSRIRCGWIYNKTNPVLGGGALGLKDGPISSKAPGAWNWDLGLATEQMHIDICKGIQDCKDIDRVSLKQRCGWCERLQKGVPITKTGKVAYPWNKMGGCPASNTVTSGSSCPAKPPADEDEETIPQPCDPLADGRISRNCVLNKYKDAGCSDKGSLGRALANGSDHDYMNSIYSQKAYQIYQARAPLGLNEFGLKRGKMSVNDALNEFDRLSSVASAQPSGGSALNYATRDLCLNQGEMDAFDFCTELKDTTVGPYTMDCLQKAFIKAGGQKDGLMYPSSSTMAKWNTYPNWKAVLDEMNTFKKNTVSIKSELRQSAVRQLLNANAGPWKVNIGASGSHEKSVTLPSGIPSNARNARVISQGHSDQFVCRVEGNNLIVRRVDNHSGWGASYVAEISEGVLPNIPNIAFVRIEGGSESLNISQIVVLDENGKNISKGRPQQVNSEPFRDANKTKVNDGDERPRGHPNQYHGSGNKDLWQVQLDGTKKVSSVIVYNRADCCQGRMASGYVIKMYAPNPSGGFREVFVSKKLNANLVQVIKMGE